MVLGSFPISGKVQPGFELSNTANDPSPAFCGSAPPDAAASDSLYCSPSPSSHALVYLRKYSTPRSSRSRRKADSKPVFQAVTPNQGWCTIPRSSHAWLPMTSALAICLAIIANYPAQALFHSAPTLPPCSLYPCPTLPHSAPCPTAAGRVAPRVPGKGPKRRSCRPG
ncbi:hypothetical protein E2C01_034016 [Portunus trituberculatus]|uniref:Uncharacterized protein n=1 Tax=Portunus trituberculatus TaxID=210409 RepID=A0A5B7EZE8_PORTR|nr:hypothetical protein [Portunus trituberculatus]